MNEKIFKTCVNFFNKNIKARYTLHFVYTILPLIMFILYPMLLINELFFSPEELPRLIAVPLGVFAAVTVMRVLINEERPYERYGMPSVFHKNTSGKSFPSRHTASAFIIAMALMYINVPIGIAGLVISVFIEASRILAGAHYIHDVVAGMVISTVTGYLFFFVFV